MQTNSKRFSFLSPWERQITLMTFPLSLPVNLPVSLSLQKNNSSVDESQISLDDFSDHNSDYEESAPFPTKKLRPVNDNKEPVFDRFTSLAKRVFTVPIALVNIVAIDRSWFKTNIGLEGAIETIQDASLCSCKYQKFSKKSHSAHKDFFFAPTISQL